jgi:predicted nucleotidyltransferase
MSNNLADAINEKFACDPKATDFLAEILSEASVYVFGGAVRDFLNNTFDTARDIDLVIESKNYQEFDIEY